MSDGVIIAAIGLTQTIVMGIIAYYQKVQAANIQKIETNTNSMKDALVATTKVAAHAEGKLEGIAQQKSENQTKP